MTTCKHCNTELNENDFVTIDRHGNDICESCEQSAWDYHQTVTVVEDGEAVKYIWCDEFGFRSAEYFEEESPRGVDGFKYTRTDGWRGYWSPEIADGYVDVASGWTTGRYDDVRWKHKFNDLCDLILTGDIHCPVPVVFSFALTSNVFSVSADIIVRKRDVEAFEDWLIQEAGFEDGIEEIREALR